MRGGAALLIADSLGKLDGQGSAAAETKYEHSLLAPILPSAVSYSLSVLSSADIS